MKFGPRFVREHMPSGPRAHESGGLAKSAAAENPLNAMLWQRMLAAFMAVVLAVSMTPSRALAAGEPQVAGEAASTASSLEGSPDENSSDAAGEGDSAIGNDADANSGKVEETPAAPASGDSQDAAAGEPEAQQAAGTSNDFAISLASEQGADSSSTTLEGEVKLYAVSIVNTKDDTSVFAVGDVAKARAREKGAASGVFVDASKLNYQWQSCDTKAGTYTDIAGATSETLELGDELSGKYIKCTVSSKVGTSSLANSTGAIVAAAGSVNITNVSMTPSSGKVEVGSTITATAKASATDVSTDSHVSWQWYKGTSGYASSCTTPIEGETSNTLTVTEDLKEFYVVAKADGGYGEQKPYYAAGPVSVAGQVELYDVQFEGTPDTSGVHVGDTLKTKVRKKSGSSYDYIGKTDDVSYQWQYASTSSSYDSAYTDIPGATEANYTVDAEYVGKYLRVKVTSENSVYSTQSKSYYGASAKSPLGPVMQKGQYKLKSIAPAEATSSTLNVGVTLTPVVKAVGSSSWSDRDVPADAELTMAWYESDDGITWTEITDGINTSDGSLALSDALVGKRVKVTASALDNTVEWVSSGAVREKGSYDLLRVTTTPAAGDSAQLVTGDSVKAQVQAKRVDNSTTNGIDVTASASISWYAADSADGEYAPIEGLSGAEVVLPESVAGKYVKAVATSGDSNAQAAFSNAILSKNSLAAAVQKLNDADVHLQVAYSADGANINAALKAELAKLGYADIDVKVAEGGVSFSQANEKATVGISDAQDATNGQVSFFFIDPNEYTGWSIDQLRYANVAFELSRDGETEYYQPNKTVSIAWDEARLQNLLNEAAESIAIGYASGDDASSVTSNLALPYRAGSNNKFEVTWTSSDADRIFVSGYGYSNYTGKVYRASSDRSVALTATVKLVSGGPDGVSGSSDFDVVVKGDPEKVAADKAELQKKIDAAFTYENVKYFGTDDVADKDGLTSDLQMPRTSALGIDGKYFNVEYSASTDDVVFNGYKGTVYQPVPGSDSTTASITLTVTDKSNGEVSASKTLEYAIAPQDIWELRFEQELMTFSKAYFSVGILDGQDESNVTGNLHAFQKSYWKDGVGTLDSGLEWSYDSTTSSKHSGIVAVELPGASESAGYRLFKSSKPGVISNENLLVAQPEYNTKVTISARLSSERFARYAERYPDNADYAALANQDVSATVTVASATGLDDPNEGKSITVTAKVVGVSASDDDGNYTEQTVVPLSEVTVAYDESKTAEDILEDLMKAAGCTNLEAGAWGLTSATMPDGRVLGTTNSEPYSFWSFLVKNDDDDNDDGYASVGAPSYYVKDEDCIEFRYVKGDGTKKETDAPVVNPSAEHPDVDVVWNGFNNGGNGAESGALTPVNPTEEASWTTRLLTDEQKNAGASVYASDPLIIGDKVYLVTSASVWGGTTWNAVLNVIDSATGAVEESVELGSSADSTCRPICSDGIIVVPLSGGYVQALSATTLETLWYTEAFTKQNLSSLTVSDGYVYINTLDYWGASSTVQNGTVKRINILTGAVAGSASSTDGGYYWAGGIVANGYYVVGGDLGQVRVYTADLSELKSSINLGSGNIRSSLVEHDGFIYAVTRDDGTLHKLSVAEDGSISEISKVQFAAYSTSTPSFSGNYAFIGGATSSGWTAKGMLSVVNLSDMSVRQITQADGSDLMAESKSTPLVVSRDGETYAYFTCNGASEQEGNWPDSTYGTGGGIYLYKLGDTEATEVYIPGRGLAQYCTASVVCDAAGNLYYTNDSGNLFCIKSQSHRVAFDSQGGSSVDDQTPADGSVLKVPSNPARAGYVFDGWYVDAACTQAYDFDTPVTADFTLYAKWRLSSANSGDDNGGQGDGSNGSSSGGGAARAAGAVAPSAAPVSAASSATSTAASASSKGAAQTSSESGATGATRSSSSESPSSEAAVASSADGESTASGVAMWAYVVLVVGLAGLAGAFVWFAVARRSKNQRR